MKWRMSKLRWLIVGLVMVFAIVRLPVALFSGFVPKPWQLGLVDGSVWHGRVGQVGVNGMQLLSDVRWSWLPSALLRGQLAWQVTTRDRDQQGRARIAVGFGGLQAEQVALRLPAAPLFTLDKRLASVQLGGDLQIDAPRLTLQDWTGVQLQFLRAHSLVTPQVNPFGDYRVALGKQGQTPTWQITPIGGALAISGSGQIDPQKGPQGALTFTPAEAQAAQFAPLMNLIGGSGPSRTMRLGGQ
ncbi:type II secretion system protein N [Chitinolyticbacter meiyuanensis]|uniref:type II secretion system protein N n=1 Tax=Chitinolyticbacter meiyuanensis TaxID=682798 RepID=UPI0011E5F309|nr:type II secretion system protein N [Chitinolyticbacter meiyuanensis]